MRRVIKAIVPCSFRQRLRRLQTFLQSFYLSGTRLRFHQATKTPEYLDKSELVRLQDRYPAFPEFGYDPDSLLTRGRLRAREILALPGAAHAKTFLELGAWDAMVCAMLQQKGKSTVAVDRSRDGLDERAVKAGVDFRQVDVNALSFKEGQFDFVFSYDAFEHFQNPEKALQNIIHVLKPGGHCYLNFGPLYRSAFGEHAYDTIRVPYCQFLFKRTDLDSFSKENGLPPIDYSHVNGWSLDQYRSLWKQQTGALKVVRYREVRNLAHLDLIRKYPTCFRNKTDCFDDLIISTLNVLFRKF